MSFSDNAGGHDEQRTFSQLLGRMALATVLLCSVSGCTQLGLQKSPQPAPMPTNPWIKPAKPETLGEKIKGIFWTEKKPDSPKDWLAQPRPD